jgi:hypothetical protein
MEEEEDISSPFWVQNSGTNHRHLSHSYALFISYGTVVIFLLVITLAFILVIVPTLHSFYSHIFKPNSVKKSWDSLNPLRVAADERWRFSDDTRVNGYRGLDLNFKQEKKKQAPRTLK